jgi:predicted nucleic acid-binding protein
VENNGIGQKTMSLKERLAYAELLGNLGSGEASCLACAQVNGGIVATDDKIARESCRDRGVAVTGTLGILLAACKDEEISFDDADAALQRMIDKGFYSPVSRISDLW